MPDALIRQIMTIRHNSANTEQAARDVVDAIRAALCASGQQVRELEWVPASYHGQDLEASAFGVAVAYRVAGKPSDWTLTSIGMREYIHTPGYQTRAAASAAAQADYERRILAALTPARQATCRKCGGTMQPGHALGQTYTSGAPDDLGSDGQTMSAGGPGVLIDCWKCEDCGWSVTADPQTEVATPTAQEAEPVNPPQPSVSVAKAAQVLLSNTTAIKTLVDFQLRHSASASDKARSMRHVQMVAALRALKGNTDV